MSTNNSHSGVSMRLLLLNNNPAVSRLIKLSADKAGYELDEFNDYGLVPLVNYDVVMVDNELYEEVALDELCEQAECKYVIYICQRGSQKPKNVNSVLEKPFLPTDFLGMLVKAKNIVDSLKSEKEKRHESVETEEDIVSEEMDAFDIDQIDTLGENEELLPFHQMQDDTPVNLEEDEHLNDVPNVENIELNDLNFEDELMDASQEPSDIKSDEEDAPEEEKAVDLSPSEEIDIEDLNLDDKKDVKQPEEESFDDEVDDEEALVTLGVLDKDDINEVKQLLDDDEQEQEEIAEMVNHGSEKEENQFFFNDASVEDDLLGDTLELPSLEESLMDEDKVLAPFSEFEAEQEPKEEDEQEEIIDAFQDLLDEKTIEEDEIEAFSFEDNDTLVSPSVEITKEEVSATEEDVIPCVGIATCSVDLDNEIDSLDDLNENLLKNAFGEEVIEEENMVTPVSGELVQDKEIEVIRGEIENSVAKSISSLAKNDILKDALKGMRINISITFDDKE